MTFPLILVLFLSDVWFSRSKTCYNRIGNLVLEIFDNIWATRTTFEQPYLDFSKIERFEIFRAQQFRSRPASVPIFRPVGRPGGFAGLEQNCAAKSVKFGAFLINVGVAGLVLIWDKILFLWSFWKLNKLSNESSLVQIGRIVFEIWNMTTFTKWVIALDLMTWQGPTGDMRQLRPRPIKIQSFRSMSDEWLDL